MVRGSSERDVLALDLLLADAIHSLEIAVPWGSLYPITVSTAETEVRSSLFATRRGR